MATDIDKIALSLTPRQRACCDNLLRMAVTGWSEARCYQEAYPNCKSEKAANSGVQTIKRSEKCRAYLAHYSAMASEAAAIDAAAVLREDGLIAFFDPVDIVDQDGNPRTNLRDMPKDTRKVLAGITISSNPNTGLSYKYKFVSKSAALDRLAKQLGMYLKDNEQSATAAAALVERILEGRKRVLDE